MVFRKNCVFSQSSAIHPSSTSLQETFEVIKVMKVYSHSYLLAIFCTTNSSPCKRRRGRKILKILGKKQIFFNNLYMKTIFTLLKFKVLPLKRNFKSRSFNPAFCYLLSKLRRGSTVVLDDWTEIYHSMWNHRRI